MTGLEHWPVAASHVPASWHESSAVQTTGLPPAQVKARLGAMAEAQKTTLETAEHVGARFPDEARAIHLGEAPMRPIYGQASLDEARALIEEGIEVVPLPPAPDDRL